VIKAEFSASVFSVTWSFRNHSNMMIWCSRNINSEGSWDSEEWSNGITVLKYIHIKKLKSLIILLYFLSW